MNYLEYFREYTLQKEKDGFEDKVRAGFALQTKKTRIIFFDLETSSPCERSYPIPSADSIIEIGAVSGDETFSKLCDPGHPVFTTSINGITTEDVAGKPSTRTVLKEFLEWAAPGYAYDVSLLIAHNAAQFDLKVLRSHIARLLPGFPCDTIYVADSLHPLRKRADASSGKLEDIYRHLFQEDYVEKHRALEDAIDLQRITWHIVQEAGLGPAQMMSGNAYPLISTTMTPKATHHFDVPFQEKDVAKKMGAKWDPVMKSWFAPSDDIKRAMLVKFKMKV